MCGVTMTKEKIINKKIKQEKRKNGWKVLLSNNIVKR